MKAVREFDEEILAYADSVGSEELVDAMINYYKGYDMTFEKDEILITNGGSEALLFALMTLCSAGENVVIPEPFYTNYNGFRSEEHTSELQSRQYLVCRLLLEKKKIIR